MKTEDIQKRAEEYLHMKFLEADTLFMEQNNDNAVEDFFDKELEAAANNEIYLAALAIVTNQRCWEYYYEHRKVKTEKLKDKALGLSKKYSMLYHRAMYAGQERLSDGKYEYFFQMTD